MLMSILFQLIYRWSLLSFSSSGSKSYQEEVFYDDYEHDYEDEFENGKIFLNFWWIKIIVIKI